MTELEKQLLSALEQLQQDYSQRLDEWESAFAEWRSMRSYVTGERASAERARVGLEHAGAEFKRAAAPLVRELNAIERRQRDNQYQKTLELERQPQKTYRGPTL